jgi:hypothetical protein
VAGELFAVALAKLVEFRRVVVEPPPELIARGELARPLVELGSLAGDAPRPDVIDEDAVPVLSSRLVVGPLDVHV